MGGFGYGMESGYVGWMGLVMGGGMGGWVDRFYGAGGMVVAAFLTEVLCVRGGGCVGCSVYACVFVGGFDDDDDDNNYSSRRGRLGCGWLMFEVVEKDRNADPGGRVLFMARVQWRWGKEVGFYSC